MLHEKRRKLLKQIGAAAGIIGASTLLSKLTPPAFPQTTPVEIEPGSFVSPADYIVFERGGEYYAKNGGTGEIEFGPSDDASQVIQQTIDALGTVGGRIKIKRGVYELNKPINLTSAKYIFLEGESYVKTVLKAMTTMDKVINLEYTSTVEWWGGVKNLYIDCNNVADYGLFLKYAPTGVIEDVIVRYAVLDGVYIGPNSYTNVLKFVQAWNSGCLLYTSPSPRDLSTSRMPSSA